MDIALIIIFSILFIVTGVYISHTAHRNDISPWRSPWDYVLYWRMVSKTGSSFQKWILAIHIVSLIVAIVLFITLPPKKRAETPADHATDDCSMVRLEGVTDDDWNLIQNNCDFCVRQLDAEHYLYMGETLSAKEVQALMPRNKEELRAFYLMRMYP